MPDRPPGAVTRILLELRLPGRSVRDARDRLYRALYADLRRIAAALMRAERPDHTLQPTAVVHEAFLRLVDRDRVEWQDRAHFLGVAARVMRQVLVDHARRRNAAKRGGNRERITVHKPVESGMDSTLQVLDLDRALQRLGTLHPRMAQVAEMRIFAGMTRAEIGQVLTVSVRTVAEDWSVARQWLARELSEGTAE